MDIYKKKIVIVNLKKIIKEKLRESTTNKVFEGLITEKLANVDDDVDLLYDLYFKKVIDELSKTKIINLEIYNFLKKTETSDTSILKSEESKLAHEINPCKILTNVGLNGYNPIDKKIYISINDNALNYAMGYRGDLELAKNELPYKNQQNSFSKEFTEEKIKGSIHHELAHWLDDTFNKEHIKYKITKTPEILKDVSINATKHEIHGQMHNIKQLHNKYKEIWNDLTFKDLIAMSPSLNNIYRTLPKDIKTQWLKDLKKRMHRENLLGKRMIN